MREEGRDAAQAKLLAQLLDGAPALAEDEAFLAAVESGDDGGGIGDGAT